MSVCIRGQPDAHTLALSRTEQILDSIVFISCCLWPKRRKELITKITKFAQKYSLQTNLKQNSDRPIIQAYATGLDLISCSVDYYSICNTKSGLAILFINRLSPTEALRFLRENSQWQ
jgi:HD superfamily phosphohydrolase YqeK